MGEQSMVKFRPITLDDAAMLLLWRNDPTTRKASVGSEPVEWEDHIEWLRSSLTNSNRELLLALLDEEPIGTVRIDRNDKIEMSWTIAPSARGKGLGKQMVRAALPDGEVTARIKRYNIASQRIALAAGFQLVLDDPLQLWLRS
ncbi:MAG: GNAT family N-acetyltransferase [Marinomonas sp.]